MQCQAPKSNQGTAYLADLSGNLQFTAVVRHRPNLYRGNKHETDSEEMRTFAGLSERQRTTTTLWICLHTAEVAGSIPASPTLISLAFGDKTRSRIKVLDTAENSLKGKF